MSDKTDKILPREINECEGCMDAGRALMLAILRYRQTIDAAHPQAADQTDEQYAKAGMLATTRGTLRITLGIAARLFDMPPLLLARMVLQELSRATGANVELLTPEDPTEPAPPAEPKVTVQ